MRKALVVRLSTSLLAVGAMDLQSLYDQALVSTESIQIQKQEIYQRREDLRQARGALLPSLDYNYRWLSQEIPSSSNGTNSSFLQNEQTTSWVHLSQPLFRGTAEYAGLELTDLNLEYAQKGLEKEELDLYLEIAELFYTYMEAGAETKNLNELLLNLRERVTELQKRSRIGRSDKSDLLSAQSQAALAESDLISAQANLVAAKESIEARIPGLELSLLEDRLNLPQLVPDLKSLLVRLEQRPDIQQLRKRSQSAYQEVRIARAGHFPILSLDGNYYFIRPGVLQDSEWDVSLLFTIPLFEGGRVRSEVRKASSIKTQEELRLAQSLRTAEADVRKYYEEFRSQLQRYNLLQRTVLLSRNNYKTQQQDYKRGLISFLQVIQTEREYWEIQRTLDRTAYQTKLTWIRLMNSVGERP